MDEHGGDDQEQQVAVTEAYLTPLEFGARSSEPEARLRDSLMLLLLFHFARGFADGYLTAD